MNAAVEAQDNPMLKARQQSVPGTLKYLVLKQQIAFDSQFRKDQISKAILPSELAEYQLNCSELRICYKTPGVIIFSLMWQLFLMRQDRSMATVTERQRKLQLTGYCAGYHIPVWGKKQIYNFSLQNKTSLTFLIQRHLFFF